MGKSGEKQAKGMIKKFNGPVNIAATFETPESTHSRIEKSTILGNYISTTGSINKSIPRSINRSLPIADANTSARFPSISNSFMIDKFEKLESELCGEIIAIKPCFMDQFNHLKMKHTGIPK